MKKILNILLVLILICSINCNAKENSIILNEAVTDDIAHTFQYPNLTINNDFYPYSITLSVEDGYFQTLDSDLNDSMLTSYNFKGGVNALDSTFVDDLNTSTKYSTITFNLKDSIDLEVEETKTSIIETITDFVRTIVFHNDENKDTKFTLTFSEVLLKLNDTENNLVSLFSSL